VGPRQNKADGDADPDHGGHGGYTIGPDTQKFCSSCETTGIYENIDKWFAAADPDIVLLALGVNDFFNAANHPPDYAATAPQCYQDLVNKILELKPNVKIVVGTVEPVRWDRNWGGPGTEPGNLDVNNYYVLVINANTKQADLKKKINGTLSALATGTYTGGGPGANNHYAIRHNGSATTVQINGNTVFDAVNTPEFAEGKIGLFTFYNPSYSDNVRVTSNNQIPVVSITSPTGNATFEAPAAVPLTASATDADGTVTRVEYFSGSTLLGTATESPYAFNWTGVAAGTYYLTARATDNLGSVTTSPVVRVTVEAPGSGLRGDYFNGTRPTAHAVLTRIDPAVDFNWGKGAPGAGMSNDAFLVRWTGQVKPRYREVYTFYTVTDGGAKLWVNGTLLIDNMPKKGLVENRGTIPLTAGMRYDIVMEYTEDKGNAVARLLWSSASQPKGIIPQARLYAAPAAGGATARTASRFEAPASSVSLYPNPVTDGDLTIRLAGFAEEQPVRIAIRDVAGRLVHTVQAKAGAQSNETVTIRRADLMRGVYLVTVTSAGGQQTLRLLVGK